MLTMAWSTPELPPSDEAEASLLTLLKQIGALMALLPAGRRELNIVLTDESPDVERLAVLGGCDYWHSHIYNGEEGIESATIYLSPTGEVIRPMWLFGREYPPTDRAVEVHFQSSVPRSRRLVQS